MNGKEEGERERDGKGVEEGEKYTGGRERDREKWKNEMSREEKGCRGRE